MNAILNIIVPVFGTVAVGWAIGRTRLLTPEGLRGLTNVTFYALFPSLLFRSMSRVRIEALSFDILFVFFGAGLLLFFASIALARAFGMRLGEGTVFALSVIFSNGVGIGIPFISYAFGEAGLVPLLMIISLNSLVMLTLASFLIEISQQASSRESLLGKLGGAATNGVLMSFPPKAEDDPKNAALVKKFRDAKYNPEGYTLFSYAAVKVWAEAAAKAKSTDAAAVAAALRSGTYDSAVGPLAFDQKGDIKNPVYDIYVWKDGKSYPATK